MDDEQDFGSDLGRQLTDELRCRLDPHLGRAAPFFFERYAVRDALPRKRRWRQGAVVGAFAAAMAACCAALALWHSGRDNARPVEPGRQEVLAAVPHASTRPDGAGAGKSADSPEANHDVPVVSPDDGLERPVTTASSASPAPLLVVGRSTRSRTFDGGTLLVGRTPMRKVRRQWLERVEWFDPQHGARLQRIVPREEIVFVPLSIN